MPQYANRNKVVLKLLKDITLAGKLSESELVRYVQSSKKRLLDYVSQNVPYYNSVLSSVTSTEQLSVNEHCWQNLPMVDKDLISKNENTFISREYSSRQWNDTSGSTGKKFRFLKDAHQRLWAEASTAYVRKEITGSLCPREMTIWGAPRDMISRKKVLSRLKLWLTQKEIAIAYQLDREKALCLLDRMRKFKPQLLSGYPNIISFLCEEDSEKIIAGANAVMSAGEWLRPDLRDRIEQHTGRRVFDFYGCRELGSIAYECSEHNGLHILSPLVYVEILRANGEPCDHGETGEIVITSLIRRTMPLIRYRLGDVGILAHEKCECGSTFPLLQEVCGRTMDYITLNDGRIILANNWTYMAREIKGIAQFQVLQDENGDISLEVVPDVSATTDLVSTIEAEIHRRMNMDGVRIVVVSRLPVNQSGKTGLVVSKYKADRVKT